MFCGPSVYLLHRQKMLRFGMDVDVLLLDGASSMKSDTHSVRMENYETYFQCKTSQCLIKNYRISFEVLF